jgi:tight adherence protein C
MSPLVLAFLSFVSLALFFAGIAWLVRNWNAPMMARLRALGRGDLGEQAEVTVIQDDRPKHAVERFLTGLGKSTATEEKKPAQPELVKSTKPKVDLSMQLIQAGIRRPNALALLTGIRLALAAGLVVLGVAAASVFNTSLLPTAFALAPIGFVLPRFLVTRMAARRQEEIQRHLPDAIDLLLLCVEAGLGLNAALVKVAEERSTNAEDPIGQELTQLSKELQVGVGRKEAFRNLAERTGAAEIRSLAAHLIQSERFGTSISQTLRQHSESMRTHRRLKAEEMANKTQIKLLFPLIMFIFPSVMIVILMPAVMRLMEALKNLM